MEEKVEKSFLIGIPAWALSCLTFAATLIPLFIIHDSEIPGPPPNTIQIITDFTAFCMLVPMACFFICRTFPKSVWYAPVICNTVGFVMGCLLLIDSISDPVLYPGISDQIIWGGNWLLSITAAIVGARMGRRKHAHQDN